MKRAALLYREFGISLSAERRRQRLSQAQFAAKVGLSRTSITNIECGRQPIQLHQLYMFATILKVEVAKLLPKEIGVMEPSATPENGRLRYLAAIEKQVLRTENPPVCDEQL